MKVRKTALDGPLVIEPRSFADDRGYFMETWNAPRYGASGVGASFCQDNVSYSRKDVLRGLHAQNPCPQTKLMSCLAGEIWDVAVDLRADSPTFGRWCGEILSAENHYQMFIPIGFAHGFIVLSETALISYKCSDLYAPEAELSIAWNDPEIGIRWPVASPSLSPKDARAPRLKDLPRARLFSMASTPHPR